MADDPDAGPATDDVPPWLYRHDDPDQGVPRTLAPGLETRIFAGERAMLSFVEVEPHTEGALHSHPEEQWGVLLEGECIRLQAGQEARVAVGHVWHTPGGVEHAVRTEDSGARILDVFAPPRPAYREAGEGFEESS